ncbi:hypothetical protein V5P93_005164 [Actinokineospora auranticolor]|uniref:Nitroreductase family protein n=1 Tax=Actinokineospora auranticolor TaxID=155976 RepID=A0A2S6GKG7_9PSEU|nr:hypothetical protein [Actinokineospora auranticolor]PPK65695.1 hypothetical protein CLV40_113179 [Actinokineospora auranticolor]
MSPAEQWTQSEVAVLAAATSRAPSVHNTQPWRLELRDRAGSVLERVDIALPRHDPLGRDRMLSCGAALTNLRLAVRSLGWTSRWSAFPDPTRRDVVGTVTAAGRAAPDEADHARFRAIRSRRAHPAPFAPEPVDTALPGELARGCDVPDVTVRVVPTEAVGDLAQLLLRSAQVLRDDRAYQRELAAWTAPGTSAGPGARPMTRAPDNRLPDEEILIQRLAAESHLVVATPTDTRLDHLRAGMALAHAWLGATAHALTGSAITQPLHVLESRSRLAEILGLPGYAQALLRLGHPIERTTPSARRPFNSLIMLREPEGTWQG